MDPQIKKLDIKLPSAASVVTLKTLWDTCKTISRTGDTFTKKDLIEKELYTDNEGYISRNLAYLKYLGLLEEVRVKQEADGKKEIVQKFTLKKDKLVSDLKYYLRSTQAGSDDSAKATWRQIIAQHDIYLTIRDEFFKGEKTKTLTDLEHFLRDKIPGNDPRYYQSGGMFVIALLKDAGLVSTEGDFISLVKEGAEAEQVEAKKQETNEDTQEPTIMMPQESPKLVTDTKQNYIITIKGPGISTAIEISNESQLAIVEAILKMVKDGIKKTESN
jgi:hypothetical protein